MPSTFQAGPSCSLHVCSLHEGGESCHVFSFAELAPDFFSHTEEFPFVAVLERTKGSVLQGPGS